MNGPAYYSPVMPYMVVSEGEAFIKFITDVFDPQEILRVNANDGSVRHGEFSINGGTIMFGQAGGEWPAFPCGMFVIVDDVAGQYAKALENGATSLQEPSDHGYGQAAGFSDGFGNQWWINTPSGNE